MPPIDAIISDVEADIYENFEREVPSRYIGERVFELLRDLDQVAFVRFASVYREFKDVNDFVDAGDLNVLALDWQKGVAAAAAVPEPSTVTLLLTALLGCFGLLRKHRR